MIDLSGVITSSCVKIVISKPRGRALYKKIVIEKSAKGYLAEKLTEKQAFHENVKPENLCKYCENLLAENFFQLNAWDEKHEYSALISKKGAVSVKKTALTENAAPKQKLYHNREKCYIIPEGTIVPPLTDMGVFTAEGKVVQSMYDKFRQINRFIEIIDDAVAPGTKELNVIDFGCGKSYLTFILYYYLTEIKGIRANVTGLDLKADVIKKCSAAAEKYGYGGLSFEVGDISGYKPRTSVDMVISLHACDTATDHALYNAVSWGARMIFSVPCCQHELNSQFKAESLEIFERYGIIQERFSALCTDAIRANLLTAAGYKTQVLEFVDLSHTPKNLLLRAVRGRLPLENKARAKAEAQALMDSFSFNPSLYNLLSANGLI